MIGRRRDFLVMLFTSIRALRCRSRQGTRGLKGLLRIIDAGGLRQFGA